MIAWIWLWDAQHAFFTPLSEWDRICMGIQWCFLFGVLFAAVVGMAYCFDSFNRYRIRRRNRREAAAIERIRERCARLNSHG